MKPSQWLTGLMDVLETEAKAHKSGSLDCIKVYLSRHPLGLYTRDSRELPHQITQHNRGPTIRYDMSVANSGATVRPWARGSLLGARPLLSHLLVETWEDSAELRYACDYAISNLRDRSDALTSLPRECHHKRYCNGSVLTGMTDQQ